jgi:hypothetical protein
MWEQRCRLHDIVTGVWPQARLNESEVGLKERRVRVEARALLRGSGRSQPMCDERNRAPIYCVLWVGRVQEKP